MENPQQYAEKHAQPLNEQVKNSENKSLRSKYSFLQWTLLSILLLLVVVFIVWLVENFTTTLF